MAAYKLLRHQVFTTKKPCSLATCWCGFRGPLPYQTLLRLPSQYIYALLTPDKWGGLKPPSEGRRQCGGSNPRNCLRTRMMFYTSFFMLHRQRQSITFCCCPWPTSGPPSTLIWRMLDLNNFQ